MAANVASLGCPLSPDGAAMLERGLATLDVRLTRQAQSAADVAGELYDLPGLTSVIHPSLPDHPDHHLAQELLPRGSSLIGLVVEGGSRGAVDFASALALVSVPRH